VIAGGLIPASLVTSAMFPSMPRTGLLARHCGVGHRYGWSIWGEALLDQLGGNGRQRGNAHHDHNAVLAVASACHLRVEVGS
jgi:hypothetical protein